jgi:hypothetical protein
LASDGAGIDVKLDDTGRAAVDAQPLVPPASKDAVVSVPSGNIGALARSFNAARRLGRVRDNESAGAGGRMDLLSKVGKLLGCYQVNSCLRTYYLGYSPFLLANAILGVVAGCAGATARAALFVFGFVGDQ